MSDKVFKTYTEQRKILEERGLIINHPRFFTNSMQHDDYYNIINGYKKYFISGMNPERYIHDTTFEQIYALYSFDQKICARFLNELIKIEKHIKSLIAYHFSEAYGYDHRQYLDVNCFKHESKLNRKFAVSIIGNLTKTIDYYKNRGSNTICHYINDYGYVPLWVLNNVLTIGQVAHFYSCMNFKEQAAIAKHFKMNAGQLNGFINFIAEKRNTCAHGSRIYTSNNSKNFQRLIPNTKIHTLLGIQKNKSGNYIIGKTDVLAILITLKYFSKKSDFKILKKHFKKSYLYMQKQIPQHILNNIHQEMGLPMNYLQKL